MTTTKHRSTFWGPQRPFNNPSPGSRYRVQLHDPLPGQHWDPAKEAQLLLPHDLVINVANQIWTVWDDPFFFRFDQNFRFQKNRLMISTTIGNSFVFMFHYWFGVNNFCYSELTAPAGNYAYRGSVTISHFEV